jgi:BirA family biotin operon repressor/biotin-[acetyl-CoA-carboxylase] ligase
MHLPLSSAAANHLIVLDEVGSTNTELLGRVVAGGVGDFTVLVSANQTAGRGRLGREWTAPPGAALAVSVFVAPAEGSASRLGWMPLLAGLAMARAVASVSPQAAVAVKWPNDVQIDGRKVAGLLCEVVPGNRGVVIGAGLNVAMTRDQLPVPTATSLVLEGAAPDGLADRVLSGYLTELRGLLSDFARSGFNPEAGLRAAVTTGCSTIGRSVRVQLPGGSDLFGVAVDIDGTGRLVVRELTGSALTPVAAGDVTHLRYE